MENAMFCYQCEQTMGGKGCTKSGVCGKTPEIANLQDLLIYQLKGISCYAKKIMEQEKKIDKIQVKSVAPLFADAIKMIFSNESVSKLF